MNEPDRFPGFVPELSPGFLAQWDISLLGADRHAGRHEMLFVGIPMSYSWLFVKKDHWHRGCAINGIAPEGIAEPRREPVRGENGPKKRGMV